MNVCTPGRRKDVTVVCNTLKAKASMAKVNDGFEALVWLLKRMGGRAHYFEVLNEMKNPKRFGPWLTDRLKK